MEKTFKIGDRVFNKVKGLEGIVVDVLDTRFIHIKHPTEYICTVWRISDCESDPKTAFLTELKELMERHDADIDIHYTNGDDKIGIMFQFGKEYISYTSRPFNPGNLKDFTFPITPSNIFDYDK